MKTVRPEDVHYTTELDTQYAKELQGITSTKDLRAFLKRWEYWLDEDTKKLNDWDSLKPLIADCRKESVVPEEKHDPAMFLLMPERIFKVSITANHFKAPWGCAYKRMKDMNAIDW